jgi:hypothetical protein
MRLMQYQRVCLCAYTLLLLSVTTASKYHVLECRSPLSYRIVKGHTLQCEAGWYCLMAFYAFDEPLPGCAKLCAQQLQHPHVRTRIGMESSTQWDVSDASPHDDTV